MLIAVRRMRPTVLAVLAVSVIAAVLGTPRAASAQPSSAAAGDRPVVTSVSSDQGPGTGGNQVIVHGTNLLPTTGRTTVRFGTTPATTVHGSNEALTVIAPALGGPGDRHVDVTVTTPAGTSAVSDTDNYFYPTEPVITSISPNTGGEGTRVVITGSDLGSCYLEIDGEDVIEDGSSDTQRAFFVPHIPNGPEDVTCTDPSGATATISFDYEPPLLPPDYVDIDPGDGPASGGNTVHISGFDYDGYYSFQDITKITVDGVSVPFGFDGFTATLTMPPHAPGDVYIEATNPAGTGGEFYTYDPPGPPFITNVSRTTVSSNGTQGITLTGQDIYNATSITVDGAPVTFTLNADAQSLFFRAPAHHAGTVPVIVTTPVGSSAPAHLTYYQARTPHISALTPHTVRFATPVTITGLALNGATTVRVNWQSIPFTQGWNSTGATLTFTAPWHSPGTWSVTVHTPAGESNIATLTYPK